MPPHRRHKKSQTPSLAQQAVDDSIAHHEMANTDSKIKKMVIRVVAGLLMFSVLVGTLYYAGHIGIACLVLLCACGLFREMVNVAHSEANAEKKIPWFRSVLYMWFIVAGFAAYTSGSLKAPMNFTYILKNKNNYIPVIGPIFGPMIAMFLESRKYHSFICLWFYAIAFVITVLCLRIKHLSIQIRILSFTVLALSLFIIPLKMTIFNTFNGLFWFIFPMLLVIINDSFAYFSGFFFGNKIINKAFLSISPNKTWEGFIGGGIFTIIASYYLPLLLNYKWLTCSYDSIQLDGYENCNPLQVFSPSSSSFSSSLPFSYFTSFEENNEILEIQYHGLFLGIFASTIAPFGGFAASAIKRAYGIKDFASFIPGHGGFMDRLDCQFLMALATYIHLKTFILNNNNNVDGEMSLQDQIMSLMSQMNDQEKEEFMNNIKGF
jgi:phosphatidate cytidylyltransferase